VNAVPRRASPVVRLQSGIHAAAPGLLWIERCRTLVAADVHFAYEDVIGGALPLWSVADITQMLSRAIAAFGASELVFLGDVVHATGMSAGAAGAVRTALNDLRDRARVTIVAGNHEGRSRGVALLGETCEYAAREGWILLHGDRVPAALQACETRFIAGHLHPSMDVGGSERIPAFLNSRRAIVLPALTPYSSGLDAASPACFHALQAFGIAARNDVEVVAVTHDRCYPFGRLSALPTLLR
jgi:metallophosphoesterase superfamily enzyme